MARCKLTPNSARLSGAVPACRGEGRGFPLLLLQNERKEINTRCNASAPTPHPPSPPFPRMVPHLHGAEHVAAAAPQPCRGVCSPRRAPALSASRLQGSVLPRTRSCPSPAGMAPAPRPPRRPRSSAARKRPGRGRGVVLHRWSSPSSPHSKSGLQKPRICKQRGFGVHRRPGFAKNVNILKLI